MQDDEKEIQAVSKAEDVESTMDEKVEKIPNLINKLNRNKEIQRQFSGPLPLQVLDNLTEEQREKLLNNFINQETKEHEANMKTLDMIRENNIENKKNSDLHGDTWFFNIIRNVHVFRKQRYTF